MSLFISVAANYEALSAQAAGNILGALRAKPDLLMCAPGGSTPRRTYELVVSEQKDNPRVFSTMRVVKLDEWGGLAMDDPASCETQLRTQLIGPLGVAPERYFGFDGHAQDADRECERIQKLLMLQGVIDLCVLGLGLNGHLGMNEPAAALQRGPHVAKLSETSLGHSMLSQSRIRPSYGLTLGMEDIMGSKEILLLVSGQSKREPLRRLLNGEITTQFPASLLWLHPRCTVLCEREAAEGLESHRDKN